MTFGRTRSVTLEGLVGTVVDVERHSGDLTRTVRVRPFVGFTRLDIVGVVVSPPRKNPRDTVLPPKPKPAPTVTVTVTPSASPSGTPGAE